jgi:hypothetical protein
MSLGVKLLILSAFLFSPSFLHPSDFHPDTFVVAAEGASPVRSDWLFTLWANVKGYGRQFPVSAPFVPARL